MENKDKIKTEKGSIMLETSMVLPIFIVVFLFLYGLLFVVSAQNQITSALFQSSKSMSMDPYLTEHVDSVQESKTFWNGLGSMILDLSRLSNSKYFSNSTDWHSAGGDVSSIAKDRFIGFFAGGKPGEAEKKAKNLGIVNGIDGIQFTTSIANKTLTVEVSYVIQTWFDAFGLGKIPVKQTVVVALWGAK